MNLQSWIDSIGAAGLTLTGVAVAAIYLCVKYAVTLTWMGWAFRRHVAALTTDPARLDPAAGSRSGNPLIRIFSEAVRPEARGTGDLRSELAFLCHKHLRKVNRAMTLLRLISVISPLLGLLGTVMGIVRVFRVIGAQTAVNPAVLATGIWEALSTTVMGLCITIPVLCLFYFFRMQIQGFQVELMEYAGRFAPAGGRGE